VLKSDEGISTICEFQCYLLVLIHLISFAAFAVFLIIFFDSLLTLTGILNVSDVGNIVRDTEKESIRNRGCRVLANLCQTTACCDVIHEDHADLFGSVVSNLSKTADKDSKVTYCRTIRLVFVCTTLCLKKTSPMFLAITRECIVGFS